MRFIAAFAIFCVSLWNLAQARVLVTPAIPYLTEMDLNRILRALNQATEAQLYQPQILSEKRGLGFSLSRSYDISNRRKALDQALAKMFSDQKNQRRSQI